MKHSQQPQQPQATLSSQTAQPSSSPQMLSLQPSTTPAASQLHRDRPSAGQRQDVASGGHSTPPTSSSHPGPFARSQNADVGQLESHTNADGFPHQTVDNVDCAQGQGGGNTGQKTWKRRGRSPRRRGAERLKLAVSSRLRKINTCIPLLIVSELGIGPEGNRQSPERGSTLWPHS